MKTTACWLHKRFYEIKACPFLLCILICLPGKQRKNAVGQGLFSRETRWGCGRRQVFLVLQFRHSHNSSWSDHGPGCRQRVRMRNLCPPGGCQKRVSRTLLQGCLGTWIQSAEQRAKLPPDTLTGTWHRRTAPAHRSVQINTASLNTLQQDDGHLGWDSDMCWIPESPSLASKGCYPGNQQSSRLYQTCLIQTLYMELVSFRAHWMPLSVLQVQQDTAGER